METIFWISLALMAVMGGAQYTRNRARARAEKQGGASS